MTESEEEQRLPGLYRMWDLQFVFDRRAEYRVHYAGQTDDGTPLFAVYRQLLPFTDPSGPVQ